MRRASLPAVIGSIILTIALVSGCSTPTTETTHGDQVVGTGADWLIMAADSHGLVSSVVNC